MWSNKKIKFKNGWKVYHCLVNFLQKKKNT